MSTFNVTLVHRESGKQIIERIVARDTEDARGKALRPDWLTGSIEEAPDTPVETATPHAASLLSDDDWTQLRRSIRSGVMWGTIWFSIIAAVVSLVLYGLVIAASSSA